MVMHGRLEVNGTRSESGTSEFRRKVRQAHKIFVEEEENFDTRTSECYRELALIILLPGSTTGGSTLDTFLSFVL